ncbi:TlpA disulfide reductase family protein, partial [Chitinophaga sp.]|uniref:TlpA disulfide reductase family protein n=1 Tax=Chitinophaga sp. TaxID=1869181 RepID=UPI002C563864
MKKILSALAGMLCLTGALNAQDKVIIKGTVNGDIQGHKEVYVYGKDIKSDTAVIENGHFQFSIPYKKDMMPLLYDQYDMIVKKGVSPFPIVIDGPGVVYLKDVDIAKGLQSGTLSGMKATEDYQAYVNQNHKIESEIRLLLKKKYGDSLTQKSPGFKAYIEEMQALNKERSVPLIKKTITSDPDSYIAAFVLATDGRELLSIEELERMYKTLSAKRQQSEYGKTVGDYIAGIKNSAIGQKAKNFTLNTPEEKPLSLEGLKGKYLVLDFWASWCGPCIKSFPHMKDIYKKYK